MIVQARTVVDRFSIEQIVPYFQPIYDLTNHKVIRYECLARLISKDDNIYLPSEFLYIVNREQTNAELTRRILELSSAYCLPRKMPWSINVFQTDLRDAGLVNWMQDLCAHATFNLIGVEIAYDSVKAHPHLVTNLIQKLPNLHITLDDVYEYDDVLASLIKGGVKAIKLRGELVTKYAKCGDGREAILAIKAFCDQTDCQLIAEHIEDDNTLDSITSIGIGYGQGYTLSQPQGRMAS
jgi:EAL domain-containing protein (putative c-di-GMP-specific phosphodiesterase class I)